MKKENISEKQKIVEERLRANSKIEVKDLFENFKTSYAGVSVVDIDDRLEEYGKNTIEIKNRNTLLHKIREAIINPFNIVLLIVAAITLCTDVIFSEKKRLCYVCFNNKYNTNFCSHITKRANKIW